MPQTVLTDYAKVNSMAYPDVLDRLINFCGFQSRVWKTDRCKSQCVQDRAVTLDPTEPLLKSSDILDARTGLPNKSFLTLLLEFCHRSACAPRFPLGVVHLEIKNFELFKNLYSQQAVERNCDFLIGAIEHSMCTDHDILVQGSDGVFWVISFDASLSTLTKMASDLNKSLAGLTIPYPPGQISSNVELAVGIAIFSQHDSADCWQDFLDLAKKALDLSCQSGRVEVMVEKTTP